ncbi:unnamed protein product [Angiostrongylus costaricensis]|uniref:Retrotransposon protein n=1 Tax=Angiostrongylus costaricensis TaxID=334426 RepID=A0A0R3PI93_ANGCS|nr:unnamed protein product [Angiostrongylus costaricensis]
MEAAWISKNYGDDLYPQCTYTCIRVFDRGLAHASKKGKIRPTSSAWPTRDDATHSTPSTTPEKNCSSQHATV